MFQANQNVVSFLNVPAKETFLLLFLYRNLCARLFTGEQNKMKKSPIINPFRNALKVYKSHLYFRHK